MDRIAGRKEIDTYCGLGGTPCHSLGFALACPEVKAITRSFRVYFNQGIKIADNEEDYLIDHSIIHYLVGPDGNFLDFYGKNLTVRLTPATRAILTQLLCFGELLFRGLPFRFLLLLAFPWFSALGIWIATERT